MSSPGFAKDVPKRVNDLLTKEFPKEYKLEWKGKTSAGVECETSVVQGPKGTLGFFKSTVKNAVRNVDVSGEANTDKSLRGEVTIKNELADGLTTILTADSNKDGTYGTFALEYVRDNASFTASSDYGKDAGSTVKASVALGQGKVGFVAGTIAEFFVGSPANRLQSFTANLGYRSREFDFVAFNRVKGAGDSRKNECGVNYFHSVNSDLSIGTEFAVDTTSSGAKLSIGSEWRQTADTTVKTAFDTTGLINFSYQQRFSPRLKTTLSATVDSSNLSKNSAVYGVSLNFTD